MLSYWTKQKLYGLCWADEERYGDKRGQTSLLEVMTDISAKLKGSYFANSARLIGLHLIGQFRITKTHTSLEAKDTTRRFRWKLK